MKFSSDELMPFSDVRTGMSHYLLDVQAGKEIVITRHGKPCDALVSAAQLYRFREQDRVIGELLTVLKSTTPQQQLTTEQIGVMHEAEQLLLDPVGRA